MNYFGAFRVYDHKIKSYLYAGNLNHTGRLDLPEKSENDSPDRFEMEMAIPGAFANAYALYDGDIVAKLKTDKFGNQRFTDHYRLYYDRFRFSFMAASIPFSTVQPLSDIDLSGFRVVANVHDEDDSVKLDEFVEAIEPGTVFNIKSGISYRFIEAVENGSFAPMVKAEAFFSDVTNGKTKLTEFYQASVFEAIVTAAKNE